MEISISTVVVEVVRVSSMMTVGLHGNFDWNFDSLDHLKWNSLSDVYWHLDSLDTLESFGDWNVLHDGDSDRNFDGERFGLKMNFGRDYWTIALDVPLCADGVAHADVGVGVTTSVASVASVAPVAPVASVTPVTTAEAVSSAARLRSSNGCRGQAGENDTRQLINKKNITLSII